MSNDVVYSKPDLEILPLQLEGMIASSGTNGSTESYQQGSTDEWF